MLVVRTESLKVADGVKLTKEAVEVMNMFKSFAFVEEKEKGDLSKCLCLKPFDESQKVEDILEEGMYEYYSTNPMFSEFKEILEELVDIARPITFTKDDILAVS